MGVFEMVVAIVVVVTIGSIIRAKHGIRRDKHGEWHRHDDGAAEAENRQLRDELRGLKERIAVLERLATDSSTHLDREIERLRDTKRDRV